MMGTPIRSYKAELSSQGSGPVVTRKMTPEELATMGRPDRMTANKRGGLSVGRRPAKITKVEYLQLKNTGWDDKDIATKKGISLNELEAYFGNWGIVTTKAKSTSVPAQSRKAAAAQPAPEPIPPTRQEQSPEAGGNAPEPPPPDNGSSERRNPAAVERGGPVNHPSHYNASDIECIDAIRAALTPEEFRGFIKGNVIKYCWRSNHKAGDQDLEKAHWYLGDYLKGQQP